MTDRVLARVLRATALGAAAVTALVFAYLVGKSLPALRHVGAAAFVRDASWAPSDGRYGAVPMLVGTVWTTLGAIVLAAPLGVAYAAVVVYHAPPRLGRLLAGVVALLAGIPSVVFGFWGMTVLAPRVAAVRPPGLCVLTAVAVLGIMVVPTVATLAEAAFRQVPRPWIEGAAALGFGRWATLRRVALPAARGGLATAVLLAAARAMGETMAVLMVAGNTVQYPRGPFDAVRTLTGNVAIEMAYAMGDHRSALFVTGLALLIAVAGLVLAADAASHQGDPREEAGAPRGGNRTRSVSDGPGAGSTPRVLAIEPAPGPSLTLRVRLPPLGSGVEGIGGGSRWSEAAAAVALWSAVALVAGTLAAVVGDLVVHGARGITWTYLTAAPEDAGRAGGIGPVLAGTTWILAVALAAAVPAGVGTAVYLAEYTWEGGATDPWARLVRRSLDVLAGVPSIVFGLFGMAFFVEFLGLGWSIASGGLTLGCMVLPVLVRATEEGLRAVPDEQRAAAAALGLTRAAALRHVLLPQAAPGIAAGLVLGTGRALAETAAVMFTAGAAVRMPASVYDSARALAYHVYILAVEVPGGRPRACTAALVLVALVLAVNAAARWAMDLALRSGRAEP